MSIDAARLAPDRAALAAAQQIAVPSLWSRLGRSERALWGEIEGSAIYEVAVDLLGNVSRCTCPSRKLPCKHALALMLLAADGLVIGGEPEAVERWLDRRAAASARERGPVKDVEAQAERKLQREARVRAGLERLDRFLDDVMRQGLGSLDGPAGMTQLDLEARRLVDAQAGGLASRVHGVAQRIQQGGDWAGAVLARLGRVALLSEAYARIERLPSALRADVRTLIGFSTSEEEVRLHGDVVTDRWFVLADVVEIDGLLRIGRTWLRGYASERDALILRFAPAGAPFAALNHWLAGHDLEATLAFYPSARPERAQLVEVVSPEPMLAVAAPGAIGVETMLSHWADALAAMPFLERMSVVLGPVTSSATHAWDRTGAVRITLADPAELLALVGGGAATLIGLWDGLYLHALGAMTEAGFAPLTPSSGVIKEPASRYTDVAVVGTGKRKPLDDLIGTDATSTLERRLVLAAGRESIRGSAGHVSEPTPTPMPMAPTETRALAPRRIAELIAPFLGAPHALVDEALAALEARGLRLPFELLTRALEAVVRRASPSALALLGARGRWLADLGVAPQWTKAYADAPGDDPSVAFVEGDTDRREQALRALRRADPEAARALLMRTWKEDRPELRERWLRVVQADVQPDDVALLEPIAAHDRSPNVRRLARRVLGHIPDSAVHRRHRARIAALGLPPALPAVIDDAPPDGDWIDDGIVFEPPDEKSPWASYPTAASKKPQGTDARLGPRARLLAGLVQSAPRALWCEVHGLTPDALVECMARGDQAHTWLFAAAWSTPDVAWSVPLIAAIVQRQWPGDLLYELASRGEALLSVVPHARRDALATAWYHFAAAYDVTPPRPWGPELSRAVLADIGPRRRRIDAELAAELHPSLIATALELEPIRRVPRVAAALDLRRRLHEELVRLDATAAIA